MKLLWALMCLCPPFTLDGPLEESFAGLTGGNTVVVTRRYITTHETQPLRHRAEHELTLHLAVFFAKPPE